MVDPSGDALAHRLESIRTRYPKSEPEMVADVVHAVLTTMSGDLSAQETSLLAEVERLNLLDRVKADYTRVGVSRSYGRCPGLKQMVTWTALLDPFDLRNGKPE